jgi:flagellar basal body-associated protein FliL
MEELVVLIVLIVLVAIGLGFVAFIMAMGQRTKLARLTTSLDASIAAIATMSAELRALRAGVVAPPPNPACVRRRGIRGPI